MKETPERGTILGLGAESGLSDFDFRHGGDDVFARRHSGLDSDSFSTASATTRWKKRTSLFGIIIVIDGIVAALAGGWLGDYLLPRMKSSYYLVSAASMLLGIPVMIVALFAKGPMMIPAIAVAAFFLLLNTAPLNAAVINSVGAHIRATALAVNIFIIHILGRCAIANHDGMGCRQALAAGRVHSSRDRHGGLFCHTVLRDEVCARRRIGRRGSPDREDLASDVLFPLDCGNNSCTGLVLPHRGRRARHAQRRRCFPPRVGSQSCDPSGNPRVSIIVPARNEEEAIEQALNSLLALDYDNYEVIAVNDRSTDRTGEIMEKIAAKSPARIALACKVRVIIDELPPGWLG